MKRIKYYLLGGKALVSTSISLWTLFLTQKKFSVQRARNIWKERCTKHHKPLKAFRKKPKAARKKHNEPNVQSRKRRRPTDTTEATPRRKRKKKKQPEDNKAKRTKQDDADDTDDETIQNDQT